MSQFSGPQARKAMRARKEQKRKEAEARDKLFQEKKERQYQFLADTTEEQEVDCRGISYEN